jgi:hypothetical protein
VALAGGIEGDQMDRCAKELGDAGRLAEVDVGWAGAYEVGCCVQWSWRVVDALVTVAAEHAQIVRILVSEACVAAMVDVESVS